MTPTFASQKLLFPNMFKDRTDDAGFPWVRLFGRLGSHLLSGCPRDPRLPPKPTDGGGSVPAIRAVDESLLAPILLMRVGCGVEVCCFNTLQGGFTKEHLGVH